MRAPSGRDLQNKILRHGMSCGVFSDQLVFRVLARCNLQAMAKSGPDFLPGWLDPDFCRSIDSVTDGCLATGPDDAGRGVELRDAEFIPAKDFEGFARLFCFLADLRPFRISFPAPARIEDR